MQLERLVKISRPRFWMYTFGPLLIGWIAGMTHQTWGDIFSWFDIYHSLPVFLLLFIAVDYFIFSANLFVYGVNDIADGDTDKYNEKKWDYEHKLEENQKWRLSRMIRLFNGIEWGLLFLLVVYVQKYVYYDTQRRWWGLALVLFRLLAYFYSSEPIRAKSKPFLDWVFNILYILPAIIGWIVAGNSIIWFSRTWFVAAWLWAMAMHAYSAIPDIEPDREAELTTTAVFLDKQGTLIYCWLLRAVGAYLWYTILWLPVLLMWAIYLLMIWASFWSRVSDLYRRFPWINAGVGFIVFRLIILT